MRRNTHNRKTPVSILAASIAIALHMVPASALAQDAAQDPQAKPDDKVTELETVQVVSTYRASLEKALDIKRSEKGVVDAIVAQDIGKFPDLNLAESLQRIPGVVIARDAGEGRSITVRGLGPQFTRVRLNGLEAMSSVGSSDGQGGANRGRGFDFNVFASDLFSQLIVRKTASADVEEGSLGATVDLRTGAPVRLRRLHRQRQPAGQLQRCRRHHHAAFRRPGRQQLGRRQVRRAGLAGLFRARDAGRRLRHRALVRRHHQRRFQCRVALQAGTCRRRVRAALPALHADGARPEAPGHHRLDAVEAERPHPVHPRRVVLEDRREARREIHRGERPEQDRRRRQAADPGPRRRGRERCAGVRPVRQRRHPFRKPPRRVDHQFPATQPGRRAPLQRQLPAHRQDRHLHVPPQQPGAGDGDDGQAGRRRLQLRLPRQPEPAGVRLRLRPDQSGGLESLGHPPARRTRSSTASIPASWTSSGR